MRRRHGGTCRCPICGQKNAGDNHVRKSYIEAGITQDEHGLIGAAKSKKHSHKVRRLREKLRWRKEET